MAQDILLWGNSYPDVPSIELPKSGGGTASFTDVTDTTAEAADVVRGKYFYTSDGVLTEGTSNGGGEARAGTVTKDEEGCLVFDASSSDGHDGMLDPIRFFDYDGTLVASYTSVPESLPSVPTHDKLTNGTWNYTLAEVTTQFNYAGGCDVGANYDTASGKTEIDVELDDPLTLSPYLRFAVNGTVTVDWGDGSATEDVTGASVSTRQDIPHTYAQPGKYTITLELSSGTGYSMYDFNGSHPLLHSNSGTSERNYVFSSCVKRVRIGANCTIGSNAFTSCVSLESVSIPNGGIREGADSSFSSCYMLPFVSVPRGFSSFSSVYTTFSTCYSMKAVSFPASMSSFGLMFTSSHQLVSVSVPYSITNFSRSPFSSCYNLRCVYLPDGFTSIVASAFSSLSVLSSIRIPNSVTTIGSSAFSYCRCLRSITIPSGVTSIGSGAFNYCAGMKEYHFLPTSPPTLEGADTFKNIPDDCIIYVPAASLTAYQTAENWSTYADYMQGE